MRRFFRFTIPSIVAMWVYALYTMVDGYFTSNYVGEIQFSAVNISMPVITVFFALGILFSVGSQALVGVNLGKENYKRANTIFSTAVVSLLVFGALFSLFLYIFLDKLVLILGVSPATIDYVKKYLRTIIPFGVFFMLSYQLEVLVKVDGSPNVATLSVGLAAITNISLDYLFIVVFQMGIFGAALATGLAQVVSSAAFIIYFTRNSERIHFIKSFDFSILKRILPLGLGDGLSELALGFTVFLFNNNLLDLLGPNSLVSYSVVSYISVFATVTMTGVSQGLAPIFSYEYGRRDYKKIKAFIKRGVLAVLGISGFFIVLVNVFSEPLVKLFLKDASELLTVTEFALSSYAWSYPLIGLNGLMITLFASLAKGRFSIILSLMRTPIAVSLSMLLVRSFLPPSTIWYVLAIAEAMVFPFSLFFVKKHIADPLKEIEA